MAKPVPQLVTKQMPVACFAPPLSDESLARYRELASAQPAGELKDALDRLLACVSAWWELPESQPDHDHPRLAIRHRGKDVSVPLTPLEDRHVAALDAVTPWPRELDYLSNPEDSGLLDGLPPGELRDAAFHLLWHVKEIALDREPVTHDKLPA